MSEKVYDNRELSWLKFNERVLEEAADISTPLMERLVFSSIFSGNLDEFFMVRVGSLHDKMLVDENEREGKTNMTAGEQIDEICHRVSELIPIKDKVYSDVLTSLSTCDVKRLDMKKLSEKEALRLKEYFLHEIKPVLSPQVIDKRHPFPFLQNKELYLFVRLEAKSDVKLGIVSCTGVCSRIIFTESSSGGICFALAEDVIRHFADLIFDNYKIKEKAIIRVTRNADINIEEGLIDFELDYRSVMSELIKRRKKLSPVRLQMSGNLSDMARLELQSRLEITKNQIFVEKSPLDMSFVGILCDKVSDKRELFFKKFLPQRSPLFDENMPIIPQIKNADKLLSYPYESIRPFIKLLQEAAKDENTISIKITLYRVAKNSKVIEALIDAAENGKEVLVLVELRARFDEENNIGWSKRLENAGCRVIYGPENLKVHSKLLLITRKINSKIEYITQIGTGNYNEKTSALYTDLSLMTADMSIASEASEVFNALALGNLVKNTSHLLVAPLCMENKIAQMLDEQIAIAKAGGQGYFGAKMNSLTDKVLIDKIIEASQAGVRVELLIRGISCLVAGVEGMTDNVSLTSIVGRFLEHSRIYIFGSNENPKVYISSADFMTRNQTRRIEVAAPIYDKAIRDRILSMFLTMLSDNVKARVMRSDGKYERKVCDSNMLNSQEYFCQKAENSARIAEHSALKPAEKLTLFNKIKSAFHKNK